MQEEIQAVLGSTVCIVFLKRWHEGNSVNSEVCLRLEGISQSVF